MKIKIISYINIHEAKYHILSKQNNNLNTLTSILFSIPSKNFHDFNDDSIQFHHNQIICSHDVLKPFIGYYRKYKSPEKINVIRPKTLTRNCYFLCYRILVSYIKIIAIFINNISYIVDILYINSKFIMKNIKKEDSIEVIHNNVQTLSLYISLFLNRYVSNIIA